MKLQVANFQRHKWVFTCQITYISSHVWHTLSHGHILYKWVSFHGLYYRVLQIVLSCSIFISSSGCMQTSLDHFSRGWVELNPARNQNLCHQYQASVKFELALHLLLLTILQLYHLPPPRPPPDSNSSCLSTWCQPLYASSCTVLLYFSRYYTVRFKMFSLLCVFIFNVLFVWKVL